MNATVWKGDQPAAELARDGANTSFAYLAPYLSAGGTPIASTLPLTDQISITPGNSVPPYFAGLLPEGRRLSALTRSVKTSADDELSLLVAVGEDVIGDVFVLPPGEVPHNESTLVLPRDVSELQFTELLSSKGLLEKPHLAGVQNKASGSMISLPASRADERYIIKFTPPEVPHLIENEYFFLKFARGLRIPVVDAQLLTDRVGEHALAVTRFDRAGQKRIAVEDGAQALGRWPGDKYNLSFEEVALGLSAITVAPIPSRINLLTQLAFAWLTGNGDLHAKNMSVVTSREGRIITPMYDLPCTLFYDDNTLALNVAGKDTLTSKRFVEAAEVLGVPAVSAERIRSRVLAATLSLVEQIEQGALPFSSKLNAKVARQLSIRRRDFAS